jgi:protoheme IX farnesyltransferase
MQVSQLSTIVAMLALVLIGVAGFDRQIVSDSACASWGACSGWAFLAHSAGPIGAMHLVVAGLIAVVTIGLLATSQTWLRDDRLVSRVTLAATVLIMIQIGTIFVPASGTTAVWAATIHLVATALLLASALALIVMPAAVRPRRWQTVSAIAQTDTARLLVLSATIAVLGALASGAYLTAASDGERCDGWPMCGLAADTALARQLNAQIVHQFFVAAGGVLLTLLIVQAARRKVAMPLLIGIGGVFTAEIAIGAASALGAASGTTSAAHFGVAGLAWAMLVGTMLASWPARSTTVPASDDAQPVSVKAVVRDYLRVTKPGIMVLLLITTLGAMLVAGAGWPSPLLILATLFGGALASGGASALNCYIDRDIDVVMARTRKRPIPTGGLTPSQVRAFGLTLSVLAVIELALLVNPIAALLALAGNLFYVLIYTGWLKRSTPQNIVIGGAAGAFPPLVGWAAVTGSLSLTAILLFALIFYWTPPHFWSLALLKARDYQRAGIPMLPVTHGEEQTRKFILMYSLLLFGVTLLFVPVGTMGMIYLVSAVVLGVMFVGFALRMYREGTNRLAWRLFKYSNYYLALLLLLMVVDRAVAR